MERNSEQLLFLRPFLFLGVEGTRLFVYNNFIEMLLGKISKKFQGVL